MEKPKLSARHQGSTDALDLSYVELQEYDSLENQSEEFFSILTEDQEREK